MANYTLLARINAGNGKFPFVTVQFSKNHRPIPIEGATYYLRPTHSGRRTPIRIGKDLAAAHAALVNMGDRKIEEHVSADQRRSAVIPFPSSPETRKTVAEAAQEYIERSKQKSHKTYLAYRAAVDLFVEHCKKKYFDEIRRSDMLDYLSVLKTRTSTKTSTRLGPSTVFNYFLDTLIFLNDQGIAKYVAQEGWLLKKDWPVDVNKRNKNKKYPVYSEQELATLLEVADSFEETLIRFLVGTGFRIGEAAVAQWRDVSWREKTVGVYFKPEYDFRPKDYEQRTIEVSDILLASLRRHRGNASPEELLFPSPETHRVDKHLDRVVNRVIDKAIQAGHAINRPRKPCHAFRVLYATRRHQNGVDIETLRQELGHSDITTTQIYLRSVDKKSKKHRSRINEADRFCVPLLRNSRSS